MVFDSLCDPDSKRGVLRWLETVVLPAGVDGVSEHHQLLRAMELIDVRSDRLGDRLDMLMRPLIDQDLTTVAVVGQTDLENRVSARWHDQVRSGKAQIHAVPWCRPLRDCPSPRVSVVRTELGFRRRGASPCVRSLLVGVCGDCVGHPIYALH